MLILATLLLTAFEYITIFNFRWTLFLHYSQQRLLWPFCFLFPHNVSNYLRVHFNSRGCSCCIIYRCIFNAEFQKTFQIVYYSTGSFTCHFLYVLSTRETIQDRSTSLKIRVLRCGHDKTGYPLAHRAKRAAWG